jgi:predicted anti-sigma-YlaC factor YlaD
MGPRVSANTMKPLEPFERDALDPDRNSTCALLRPLLSAALDEELTATEHQLVANHLASCRSCRSYQDALRVPYVLPEDLHIRLHLSDRELTNLTTNVLRSAKQRVRRDNRARHQNRRLVFHLLGALLPLGVSLGLLSSDATAVAHLLPSHHTSPCTRQLTTHPSSTPTPITFTSGQ